MNFQQPITRLLQCATLATMVACSNDSDITANTTLVDLSFSDAAVDNVSEVVISVERITFVRRSNGESDTSSDEGITESTDNSTNEFHSEANEDIVVEKFVSSEGGAESETFTLDLLTVQGEDRRLVIDSVELPVGVYANMLIEVTADTDNASYVVDATGTKTLKVPSNVLKLGGFTIEPTSKQSMVVEFGLQQSMTYNPGPDRYILKPRGVRIVSVDNAALVDGVVDHAALQASEACTTHELGGTAGSVYLYAGHALTKANLADNFDSDLNTNIDSKIAPVASASLLNDSFALSYLEPGDYTLAISCHEESDDADLLQNLLVPNPSAQITEFSISAGQTLTCTVPLTQLGCTVPEQKPEN